MFARTRLSGSARALCAVLFTIALWMVPPERAHAQSGGTEVDVALVLAVDISYSMDPEELALQRQGYVEALRSREFQDALAKGMIGKVAIAYVEWAGSQTFRIIAPWTIVEGPESAAELSSRIAKADMQRAYRTSIASAIDRSVELLETSGIRALRRVIDISGDGPNNQGRWVTQARDDAVAKGITINGLPILIKRPGYMDIADLDEYYRECVIGGQNAFVVPIRSAEQFALAIRTKLVLEIASTPPPARVIDLTDAGADITAVPVQSREQDRSNISCAVGERQWQDRMGN